MAAAFSALHFLPPHYGFVISFYSYYYDIIAFSHYNATSFCQSRTFLYFYFFFAARLLSAKVKSTLAIVLRRLCQRNTKPHPVGTGLQCLLFFIYSIYLCSSHHSESLALIPE